MGFVLKTNCKKKPFIVFHFWEFQKQQQEGIAVSPQYWAKAAATKKAVSPLHWARVLPQKWLNNNLLQKIPTYPFDSPKTRKQTLY